MLAFLFMGASAHAQQLEPRSYTNTPVGLNFLLVGYGYTEGSIGVDPAVPITDAQLRTNSAVVGYSRSLGAWGRSGKVAVVLPYTGLEGSALVEGQPRQRQVAGFADPLLRFSMNFYGAPALSVKDFAGYRQDLIIGGTLVVSAPLGQYDASKLVNLGANRWSFKAELGLSKAWGAWTVELAPSVTLFTDNNDFFDGGTLEHFLRLGEHGGKIVDEPVAGIFGVLGHIQLLHGRARLERRRANSPTAIIGPDGRRRA